VQILYILFGWLLGLLSQPIASRVEKYFKRILIDSELRGLIFRLAVISHRLQDHLGSVDKSSIEWLKNICQKYGSQCSSEFLQSLDGLSAATLEQIQIMTDCLRAPEGMGISVKPFPPPFSDSGLQQLWILDKGAQEFVLDIKSQVAILNDEIEGARFYHRLTFDPSSMEINEQIIRQNLRNRYEQVRRKCRFIADRIEKYLGASTLRAKLGQQQ